MMKRMRTLRGDLLGKVATVALIAAAVAGCSSAVERFGSSPYYTGSTQNQRDILGGAPKQPSYQDIVRGPGGTEAGLPQSSSQPLTTGSISNRNATIQSAPLPAPNGSTASSRPAPAGTSTVATLPAPEVAQAQDVTGGNAKSWKGWSSAGGPKVQVRQGDDLNTIARRYGVPVEALAAVNGVDDPKGVRPGQTIIIPTYAYADNNGGGRSNGVKLPSGNSSRPILTASTGQPVRKPGAEPSFNDVGRGDVADADVKLVQISAAPKRKPGDLSGSLTTASVSPRDTGPSGQMATQAGTVEKKPALPAPSLTQETRPTEPIKTPPVVASVQEDADVSVDKFRWPVNGRIISEFGAKPGGGKNEGVNLAVPEGTPVKAANDGTVIYSGNELKGYGNLILLRHSDGWVSAYAHNSELKVKRGDSVRRGDVVSLAGATGSVNQPQLHFELRQGNKPVDPLRYLPRR